MVNEHRLQGNIKSISKEDVVTKLNPSDVLLGRGSPTINYGGNVAFRSIIKARKAEYTASGQHKIKDRVAREILKLILDKGGRFLRRIDPVELEKLEISSDKKAWCSVEEEVALEKVKQALRDKDQGRHRSKAREAIALKQATSSRTAEATGLFPQAQAWMLQNLVRQQNSKDLLLLAHLQCLHRKNMIDELANGATINRPMAAFPTLQASLPFTADSNFRQPLSPAGKFLFR